MKQRNVDVTVLFNLATGFTRMQNDHVRTTSRFGLFRCGLAKLLGFFAHMATTLAFKILPLSENHKLPTDLVRKELVDMAIAPRPNRCVDNLNSSFYPPAKFHPITLNRPIPSLVDTDMKEMMTPPGNSSRKVKK